MRSARFRFLTGVNKNIMKTTKILLSALSAALVVALSGCGNSSNPTNTTVNVSTTTANTANQSNGATVAVNTKSAEANKTTPAAANNSAPYTPEVKSAERTAIFDALRVPVAKELKQDVSFIADKLRVQGDWAFVAGKARNAQGGAPDWKITKYQEMIDNGDFEDNLFALLKKSGDRWSVVTYTMNCMDVCYLGWDKEFKAPKAIFE